MKIITADPFDGNWYQRVKDKLWHMLLLKARRTPKKLNRPEKIKK